MFSTYNDDLIEDSVINFQYYQSLMELRLNKLKLDDYSVLLGVQGLIAYGSLDDLTTMPIVALTDFL